MSNFLVSNSFDLDGIIRNINSVTNKLDGLNDLLNALSSGCSSASFLGQLEKLFSGLRQCLLAESTNIDIVLKANTVLLEMIPDIQHSDDLEIQFAQLIPIFIDNLGSPKVIKIILIRIGSCQKVNPQVHRHLCQNIQEVGVCDAPHFPLWFRKF